ncbi:desulfoferrodoxin family protein [Anaerobium acetethylicum]|uniref:Superoxide reductase n=1 Tax=Anaerobium acetethylicum TaxID=1619234 RepID=A0A1D3TR18_9FIRM|nr:desulfoferrodoxin family protein [Anaerobium acetethylicum]SCP96087.1 superoxide reductase [Anaerobium acetethylicum]
MKKEAKFFICKHCGNLVTFIAESGVPMICCGEEMTEIVPNTQEAATEKHIPVITRTGLEYKVKVGSVEHPMIPEHYIEWIYMETKKGFSLKYLNPGEMPEVVFKADEDEPVAFYAYCNIHGLWKAEK